MNGFIDKVVLITGAARGLGQELAVAFSSLGASVAANDINPISLDETVALIHQAGGKARPYVFDVAKRMPIEAMVDQVLENYGRIDVLVNHASVAPDTTLLEMDEWEFHRTLDVNLGGTFFAMQQVGRVMRQQGAGKIVNLICTAGGKDFHKGHAAHLASQVGLIGLTQAAASEFSSYHIQVNAVYDGPLGLSPIPSPTWDLNPYYRWQEAYRDLQQGDHAGVVNLVLFACSGTVSSLTGQVLSLPSGI